MCGSRPQAPKPTALPPPPPPPPNASPTAPVIDPAQKDLLLNRPKRRGLSALRIDRSTPAIGLNIAQG